MSDNKRRIYTLNGLEPEVVAVTFAKTSRSPLPFDQIAAELDADKSRKFHERWVVGYGHSSVAEHAVLSIAIENVSILATKVIEDNRLASYTEKSSRYQVFDKDRYYTPEGIGAVYSETCDYLLDVYAETVEKLTVFLHNKYPQLSEIELKNKVLDSARYLLPVSVLTNLGMTVNARNLEYAIVKLLTHPLKEMQEIGKEIKEAALKKTPTLVKYTNFNEYLSETSKEMEKLAEKTLKNKFANQNGAALVEYDKDAENKLACALLYRFSKIPYKDIKKQVKVMSDEEKEKVIEEALKRLGNHDRPLRELESVEYVFDVLVDYGAFRDIQRHRICTQSNQDFNVFNGYSVPKDIIEAELKEKFVLAMERAKNAYNKLVDVFPKDAQYVIPLAYNKRVLMKMNLRELFHFIKLRSGKMGHESYRKIAQQMYGLIKEKHLLFAKYIQVDFE